MYTISRQLFLTLLFLPLLCAGQRLKRADLDLVAPSISHCTPVKDQHMSSTCWSFSSTSLLESELIKLGKGTTDLSEMFIARHSMLRKIGLHLKLKGRNFFTPGGQFHDAVWVMKNFGLVPEEAYPGKGRGEVNHNHAEMDTALSRLVKQLLEMELTGLDPQQEKAINNILDQYYGPVPTAFNYKGRVYTPRSFMEQYLGLDPDNYVEITSYTHHPFFSKFVLEDKYNWTGDSYWNVPLEDFSAITNTALEKGFTVGWDGDARDDYFDFNEGLAYIPGPIDNYRKERQQAFEDKTTELDHMMHIAGKTTAGGKCWYYVKNSWGEYSNGLGGYIWMREDYFMMRTLAIIVNKAAIPFDIRKKMGL